MQVLRCWESHYGPLSAPLTTKFLNHHTLEEICGYPSGLVFTLLRRNKKLDSLLRDIKRSVKAWEDDEDSFRRSVYLPVVQRRKFPLESLGHTYPINSTGQSTLAYWNDYYYDDDGPFEKTEATLWEDHIFGDGFKEGDL